MILAVALALWSMPLPVRSLQATGADIVDRADGRFPVRDFLADNTRYTNLVFNPASGSRWNSWSMRWLTWRMEGTSPRSFPLGFLAGLSTQVSPLQPARVCTDTGPVSTAELARPVTY